MSKRFKITTVLSAISGINITDNFSEVFELYWYVFNDNTINDSGLIILRESLLKHLTKQYKELSKARFYIYTQYSVLLQKYGETLEISPIYSDGDISMESSVKIK